MNSSCNKERLPEAVFLCRADEFSETGFLILQKTWPQPATMICIEGNTRPENFTNFLKNKVLFSFRSHLILTQAELHNLKFGINFHPAPPNFRGVGGYNFALYDDLKYYGVLAHIMEKELDSGKIIGEKKFKIDQDESIKSLKEKSNEHLLVLFEEVLLGLLNTDDDPNTALQNMPKVANWEGKLFTRRDLNALCQINLGTTVQEFQKRYKACSYPPYHSLFLQVGKKKYKIKEN